jgi:hypothetical protein
MKSAVEALIKDEESRGDRLGPSVLGLDKVAQTLDYLEIILADYRAAVEPFLVAALAHAGIDAGDALLYPLEGSQSKSGYSARSLARHLELQPEAEWPELEPFLDEMNHDECIDNYRIVVFTERTIEGTAALLRHELEHSLQRDVHGQPILELHGVAEGVIGERVRGLCGGGFLYQAIPDEMDANAAAATFVRGHFGAGRIDDLLSAGDGDGSAFRSLVDAAPPQTLPDRMIRFLASVPDLCEKWAEHQRFDFPTLLNLHWRGAGDVWERLVTDDDLSLADPAELA